MGQKRPVDDAATTTVLIVDDHQMFRDFLAAFIDREDDLHVIGYVGTVRDAFEAAVNHRPTVILMDHMLPDGSGSDAIPKIKAELPDTKVIMVTGMDNDAVLLDSVVAGCSGFVSKGSAPSEVLAAIRLAARGDAVLPDRLSALLPRIKNQQGRGLFELTQREVQILRLLAQGLTNREIADSLFISLNTVRNHVQRVITKLGAHSKLEAVATAVRERVIQMT
jgi:DNA-binding NarL/FixJ family response regulator